MEALRSILWEAMLAELREPSARLVADLADRLSYVLAAALTRALGARRVDASTAVASAVPRHGDRARVLHGSQRHASGAGGAVLVDELAEEPRPLAAGDDSAETLAAAAASGARAWARGRNAERSPEAAPARGDEPSPQVAAARPPVAEPSRTVPRARPWDTPLSDDSMVRARRGPGARVDERGSR